MKRVHGMLRRSTLAALLALGTAAVATGAVSSPVSATTVAGTLSGEGGTFLQPVMSKLLEDDTAGLAPDYGAYTGIALNSGIADFVGTGKGAFDADYALSERPLTAAETAKAKANGRSFAYVPIAATPVAIVTLVPNQTYQGGTTITPSQFCQHIPLSATDMGDIFGFNSADPLQNWSDVRLQCAAGSTTTPYSAPIIRCANLDPTMSNYAVMNYLDSDATTKSLFDAGLQNAVKNKTGLTTVDTPSESWPYTACVTPGGDEPFIGKLIGINAKTNAPSTLAAQYVLGAAAPLAADWTGAPLGVSWNLPTAAVENAQGSYVAPSSAAAAAAEADATMSPSTNLVTFNASMTDAAAYNSELMEESYLVVPTSGLAPDKAVALAQFIRFALGTAGQKDIEGLGAAPATAAMAAAGLKVAADLDATVSASDSTTTTSPTTTSTTVPVGSTSTTTTTTSPITPTSSSATNSGSSTGSGSSLAFTGAAGIVPLSAIGLLLTMIGAALRRRSRRKAVRS